MEEALNADLRSERGKRMAAEEDAIAEKARRQKLERDHDALQQELLDTGRLLAQAKVTSSPTSKVSSPVSPSETVAFEGTSSSPAVLVYAAAPAAAPPAAEVTLGDYVILSQSSVTAGLSAGAGSQQIKLLQVGTHVTVEQIIPLLSERRTRARISQVTDDNGSYHTLAGFISLEDLDEADPQNRFWAKPAKPAQVRRQTTQELSRPASATARPGPTLEPRVPLRQRPGLQEARLPSGLPASRSRTGASSLSGSVPSSQSRTGGLLTSNFVRRIAPDS